MPQKRNETDLTTWTVKELKSRAIGLYGAIHQMDCFNSHDIHDLEAVQAELERRGYIFEESKIWRSRRNPRI